MSGPLLIGVGNPLRGDDGVGHEVVRALAARRPALRSATVHQLTLDLALDVSHCELVIFVDASLGARAVTVRAVDAGAASLAGSHHVTPAALLAMAAALFGSRPTAWLVEVPVFVLDHGDELSREAAHSAQEAVERVEELLEALAPIRT